MPPKDFPLLFVESRVIGWRVAENRAASGKSATFVKPPGLRHFGDLAGFQNKADNAPVAGEILNAGKQRGTDAPAPDGGIRVHALDFAKPPAVILQRPHSESLAVFVSCHKKRDGRSGHLLDRKLILEFRRRQRVQEPLERTQSRAGVSVPLC